MLNQNEITKLKKWVSKTFFEPNNLAIDSFDINSEIDSSLSYEENKTILREKLKTFLQTPVTKEIKTQREYLEFVQLKEFKEKEDEAKRVFEAEVYKAKESTAEVTEKYHIPIEYIKSVARGYNKSFIFLGGCGLGKSFITRQILAKENVKFIESRGVNSPLGFYQFLYEHNDKDIVLVFDDVAQLIDNPNAYSILLGVLWEGLASWNSTTGKLKIPKQFIFNSRIIIIANRLKGELRDFAFSNAEIVKSRCLTHNLEMNRQELIEMMYLIAKQTKKDMTTKERIEIVDFIKENSLNSTGLDLRTQVKAENLYLYDKQNWKELVLPLLPKNNIIEVLEFCIKQSNSVKEAQKQFCEETGYSRRQFYRIKHKLIN